MDALFDDEPAPRRGHTQDFVDPLTGETFDSKEEFKNTMREHKNDGDLDFDGKQTWVSGHRVKV
jgi:hypothetical protein